MTPTREQVKQAVRSVAEKTVSYEKRFVEDAADAIMALLEPPKPPARRWIVREDPTHYHPGTRLCISFPGDIIHCYVDRELPPMPSMEQLEYVYGEAWLGKPGGPDDSRKAGITAVLRACGLEVEAAKR